MGSCPADRVLLDLRGELALVGETDRRPRIHHEVEAEPDQGGVPGDRRPAAVEGGPVGECKGHLGGHVAERIAPAKIGAGLTRHAAEVERLRGPHPKRGESGAARLVGGGERRRPPSSSMPSVLRCTYARLA